MSFCKNIYYELVHVVSRLTCSIYDQILFVLVIFFKNALKLIGSLYIVYITRTKMCTYFLSSVFIRISFSVRREKDELLQKSRDIEAENFGSKFTNFTRQCGSCISYAQYCLLYFQSSNRSLKI